MHALCGARIFKIKRRDIRMRHRTAKHERMKRALRCDIVHIAPVPCQKPNIFYPLDGLAFAKLFHALSFCTCVAFEISLDAPSVQMW